MPRIIDPVIIDVDTSEFHRDLDAIDRGEIKLPTVSAVQFCVAEGREEDVVVYIGDCDAGS